MVLYIIFNAESHMKANITVLKRGFCLIIMLIFSSKSIAQFRNRGGIGLSYSQLDYKTSRTFMPNIAYQRLISKRLFLTTQIGVASHDNLDLLIGKQIEKKRRTVFDFAPKFAVIKYKDNYFKIGGDFTFMFINDEQFYLKKDPFQNIIEYGTKNVKDYLTNFNLVGELDVSISRRFSVASSFHFINMTKSGFKIFVGLNGFYKF